MAAMIGQSCRSYISIINLHCISWFLHCTYIMMSTWLVTLKLIVHFIQLALIVSFRNFHFICDFSYVSFRYFSGEFRSTDINEITHLVISWTLSINNEHNFIWFNTVLSPHHSIINKEMLTVNNEQQMSSLLALVVCLWYWYMLLIINKHGL